MASDYDVVWSRVKDAARDYGERGIIPSEREAEDYVLRTIVETKAQPRASAAAVRFYVAELITRARMIVAERDRSP